MVRYSGRAPYPVPAGVYRMRHGYPAQLVFIPCGMRFTWRRSSVASPVWCAQRRRDRRAHSATCCNGVHMLQHVAHKCCNVHQTCRVGSAHCCHICTGTGLIAATSAAGPGSPPPHLHRDWAHRRHICTGTWLPTVTSAPGPGSPLPHLHWDLTPYCHICTGTGAFHVQVVLCGVRLGADAARRGGALPHAHRCAVSTHAYRATPT
jgi:hypothetical protein